MEDPDREKIAVVLVYKYKKILDDIKKDANTPDKLAGGQVVELDLMGLTEDRPVARKFLNEIIEYRRDKTGAIRKFAIPVIEGVSGPEEQPKQEAAVETGVKSEPAKSEPVKKPEPKKDEDAYPFDF